MKDAVRLLLVDDDPDSRYLVIRQLREELPLLEVVEVADRQAMNRALELDHFDLAITDYQLHWSDGIAILKQIKERMPECPVIMFTGTGDAEVAVEGMKQGLDDYIVKSTRHLIRLRFAVRSALLRANQQLALRIGQEEFRRLILFSPLAMAIYDDSGAMILVNDKFVRLFGYPAKELATVADWWQKAFPDLSYREEVLDRWQEVSREAAHPGAEFEPLLARVTCRDGLLKSIELYPGSIGNKHLIILNDVSQLKLADEKLLLLAAIVDSTDDAIICKDLDGIVTSWNRGAEKIYGYSGEEMIGSSIAILFPEDLKGELKQILQKVSQGQHIEHFLTKRRRKDGKIIDISLTISPIRDEQGRVVLASVIANDITHLVSLENQLRQAQKMEALGTLAGGVAHDFNNILTAIIGHASLLELKMAQDDPLAANVHEILDAASRAANLTQALLGFSRKQPIETKPTDLNGIVKKVQRLLVMLLKENVELRALLSEEALVILADAVKIEQVLINLATNARDSIVSSGAVGISTDLVVLDQEFVRAHGYGRPGRYALLSFSDTGTGMEEQTRLRIFEPFFTTKASGRGTGLGLSIVYSIVKQHGGYITCYSEPGQGTTFHIYLPMIEAGAEQEAKPVEIPPKGGKETILVAEDDGATRRLDREVLEAYGYRVIEAVDGEDALEKYHEFQDQIDLLFLDTIMPRRGGREVYEEVRRVDPHLKILFTSGYAAEMLNDLDKEEVGFIAKPILPTVLLKKIREILDREPLR